MKLATLRRQDRTVAVRGETVVTEIEGLGRLENRVVVDGR